MHIVHLTSAHPRYDIRIFLKQCISLAKRYTVSLIVADGLGDEVKHHIQIFDYSSYFQIIVYRILLLLS